MKKGNKTITSQILSGVLKFLAVSVSFILLIVIIIPSILSLVKGQDIPPIDETELQLQVVDISKEENLFYDLDYDIEKVRNSVILKNIPKEKEFVLDYLDSDKWDKEVVENILADNENILQNWTSASDKGKFQLPYTDGILEVSGDMPVTPFNIYREVSRLSGIKAIYLAKNGQEEGALDEAMKNIIVGSAIENSQSTLIAHLVGRAVKNTGLDVLQKVISIIPENSQVISEYPFELENYQAIANPSPFIVEYLVWRQGLDDSSDNNNLESVLLDKILLRNKFYFKKNLTISYYSDFYNQLVVEAEKDCSQVSDVSYPFRPLATNNVFKLYFTENLMGKLMSSFPEMAFNNVLEKKCTTEQKLKETNLIISSRQLP